MRSTGIQLRVSDLLFALQKRWKLIISLTFLGLVFGLLLTGMTYVQDSVQFYRVRGSFSFTTTTARARTWATAPWPTPTITAWRWK